MREINWCSWRASTSAGNGRIRLRYAGPVFGGFTLGRASSATSRPRRRLQQSDRRWRWLYSRVDLCRFHIFERQARFQGQRIEGFAAY